MTTTHDVRVWSLEPYYGARKTTYRVRWVVAGAKFSESFDKSALADSFRSQLVSATARGEAFDIATGLPVSIKRKETKDMPWLDFVCKYMYEMWPDWSPNHRHSTARSLMNVTLGMLTTDAGKPGDKVLHKAILTVLSKTARYRELRKAEPFADEVLRDLSPEIASALTWVRRNVRGVRDLASPEVLRGLLQSLEKNLDGERASTNTVRLRRIALSGAVDFAIECELLESNPIPEVKTRKRKQTVKQVDPRSVVNPMQARMLINSVGEQGIQGERLKAFFGCIYYGLMRPEEVCNLQEANLALPDEGWGDIHLKKARPEVRGEWTDSGKASEERSLKHRDDDEGRTAPCPPALTQLLHEHVRKFGTAPDGRLFRGARDGGRVGSTIYGRVWARARAAVFTTEVIAGPLGKRPYDLRHAGVSTYLTSGVEATRVAAWAGHSLTVLLTVYAKCLDGGEADARQRVERLWSAA